ncbi:MAG: hydrogenase maturation nickel metallochaperone HypA [Anaerolineales bacterium]
MHELSVTQALLDLVVQRAATAQAARVTDIYIEIGDLASYVDESIQFYWDIISAGTAAKGARLHFERIPLTMHCTACEKSFQPDGKTFNCPGCGSEKVRVMSGEEFRLVGLDVERAAQPSALEVENG